jgi:hypothetical protein
LKRGGWHEADYGVAVSARKTLRNFL